MSFLLFSRFLLSLFPAPSSPLSHLFSRFPLFSLNSLRLTQFIETSRCRTHVRSALRASGAALVLVPSSSALAAVTAAAAAAVGSDDADAAHDADDDNNHNNQNSSVVLIGLAAAIAAEGLSPVPWPRSAFDDTRASSALQLAAGGWESKAAVEKAKYLSLGAAGAFLFFAFVFGGALSGTKHAHKGSERGENEAGQRLRKERKKSFNADFFSTLTIIIIKNSKQALCFTTSSTRWAPCRPSARSPSPSRPPGTAC